jgi:hypothetical protein
MRAIDATTAVVVNERGFLNSDVAGAIVPTTSTSTTPYIIQATDYYIGVNYNGAAIVVLPVGITGRPYIIKDESGALNGSTRTITVSATSPNTIDGLGQATLVGAYASLTVIFNNNWNIV